MNLMGFATLAVISGIGRSSPETVERIIKISTELEEYAAPPSFSFWILLTAAIALAAFVVHRIAKSRGVRGTLFVHITPALVFLVCFWLFNRVSRGIFSAARDLYSEDTPMTHARMLGFFGSNPLGIGLLVAGWFVTHPLFLQSIRYRNRWSGMIVSYGLWFSLTCVALCDCVVFLYATLRIAT